MRLLQTDGGWGKWGDWSDCNLKAYDEFGGYDSPLFDTDAAGGQGRGSGDNDRKCLCRKRECDSPSPAGKLANTLRNSVVMGRVFFLTCSLILLLFLGLNWQDTLL